MRDPPRTAHQETRNLTIRALGLRMGLRQAMGHDIAMGYWWAGRHRLIGGTSTTHSYVEEFFISFTILGQILL